MILSTMLHREITKKFQFLFLFAALNAPPCFSQTTTPSNASSLYKDGKFQEALEALQKQGFQTATDYYNAGNCYFKLGKLGQALGYYEKAHSLAEGDKDIRYNLTLTEHALEASGSLAHDVFAPLRAIPEEILNLSLAAMTFGLALLAYRCRKKSLSIRTLAVRPSFIVLALLWFATAGATAASFLSRNAKLGVVVADISVARSGPSPAFTELFKLTAGTKIELTGEKREGWRQIRFSLGNMGWIMEKDLLSL